MRVPNFRLLPDWDEDNISHVIKHGIIPEQVEEVYYSEGPFPAIAVRRSRPQGKELRYRLWGTDAAGKFIEVIAAVYPEYGVWRCVTAYPMSRGARKAYLKRVTK